MVPDLGRNRNAFDAVLGLAQRHSLPGSGVRDFESTAECDAVLCIGLFVGSLANKGVDHAAGLHYKCGRIDVRP